MTQSEISKFLMDNIAPIDDEPYGRFYRASAYLTDGTYLPCVMFGNPKQYLTLAKRRLAEMTAYKDQYDLVVRAFVIHGGRVDIHDVDRIEASPFAWPEEILSQIGGETTMGWTAFTAVMNDGKVFGFGTGYNMEFFDLPKGYTYDDIAGIHNGMVVMEDGAEREFSPEQTQIKYLRDQPYFYCYSEHLPE